jgi:hypothetical protein
MKAVNYAGPSQVKVSVVEKPKLEHPDDIIVKVTTVSLSLLQFAPITYTFGRRQFAAPTYSMYIR